MATFDAIKHIGKTLVRRIQRRMDEVFALGDVKVKLVTSASFARLGSTDEPTVSVFLYRVVENTELRNQAQLTLSDGRIRRQPLTLELCYLVTAWAKRDDTIDDEVAAEEEHRLLGLVLQALADAAELGRAELFEEPGASAAELVFNDADGAQILLESLPVEDHYRIWDSADLDYRLSLTYRVRVIGIDPVDAEAAPRVAGARIDYGTAGAP